MIDAMVARATRRLLQAAARRLASLEHPSGYRRTHHGDELLREATAMIREALVNVIEGGRA